MRIPWFIRNFTIMFVRASLFFMIHFVLIIRTKEKDIFSLETKQKIWFLGKAICKKNFSLRYSFLMYSFLIS